MRPVTNQKMRQRVNLAKLLSESEEGLARLDADALELLASRCDGLRLHPEDLAIDGEGNRDSAIENIERACARFQCLLEQTAENLEVIFGARGAGALLEYGRSGGRQETLNSESGCG